MIIPATGVNHWEPPKGPCTPNDIVVPGTFECYGWWETYPGMLRPNGGAPLLVGNATIDTMGTWGTTNLQNWGTGQADPDGGNAAFLLQETVDGAPTSHQAQSNCTNQSGPWCDFLVWGKPINRDWGGVYMPGPAQGIFVNWNSGATAPWLGVEVTAADLGIASGGRWFLVSFRCSSAPVGGIRIYSADNTPTQSYIGTGLVCSHVYTRAAPVAIVQAHATTMYDMSRNLGVPRTHDLTQTTVANEPLYNGDGWIDAVVSRYGIYSHGGRDAFHRGNNANLTGVVAGTDQPFACIGVASFSGAFGQVNRWYHDGTNHVIPFYVSGADLRSQRWGAVGSDNQVIQLGGAAQFATRRSYAYIFNSNRTGALWVDGVQVGTFTHGAAGAITMAPGVYYNNIPVGGGVTTAEVDAAAVFKGQVPGTTLGEQYSWLQRALIPMASRWSRPA